MSIETVSKAPANEAPKANEASAKKNASGSSQGAEGDKSFLAILGALDDGASSVVPDTADLLGAEDRLDKLKRLGADGLLDPALLLAQVPIVATPVSAPEGAAKSMAKVRSGHIALQPEVGAGVSASAQLSGEAAKLGKAALTGGADAKATFADALNAQSAPAGPSGQDAAKEVLSEKVVKFVQELVASMAKPSETSALALGGGRERTNDMQPMDAKARTEDALVPSSTQQGANGAMGVDGVVATSDSAAADGEFSEQVNYWIGQDIQKAELTLDGLGLSPVEVSISMQGNEAQVVFRTDEAQTRDALSNASQQLQEALSRQGVALAGVSVGTSNSGGAQQQGWRVASVEAAPERSLTRAVLPSSTGRSVDLFV